MWSIVEGAFTGVPRSLTTFAIVNTSVIGSATVLSARPVSEDDTAKLSLLATFPNYYVRALRLGCEDVGRFNYPGLFSCAARQPPSQLAS
jgi:hypothetical protein